MNMRMKISKGKKERNISITFDAGRFERVAANFGMFSKPFLDSLDRAERDVVAGRTAIISSLKDLRG